MSTNKKLSRIYTNLIIYIVFFINYERELHSSIRTLTTHLVSCRKITKITPRTVVSHLIWIGKKVVIHLSMKGNAYFYD